MSKNKPFYKGAMGNLSLHTVTVAVSLAASAEQTIMESIPVGTEILGVEHVTDALGANTAIEVNLVDADGGEVELLAMATTSASADIKPIKPVYVSDNGPSDVVLKNTGTATATGEVVISIKYRFKGY